MKPMLACLLMAAASQAAEMKVRRDIAYVKPKSDRQTLDVYTTQDAQNRSILVWIHGGGWRQGDKKAVQQKPQALVDKGFAFVSVNYRFVPNVTVKEMTGDIAKAIKWSHENAKKFGGDAQRIFVAGHSAGAHLAALVCTDERYLKAEGLSLANINGCIPVDTAAYDIPKQVKSRSRLRAKLYTSAFGETEKTQKAYSPLAHVEKGKHVPPFLILHVASRKDSTAQSQAFAEALQAIGVKATVYPAENKNHGTINRELGQPNDPPTKAMFRFLEATLQANEKNSPAQQ